jgi:hypothetical protein
VRERNQATTTAFPVSVDSASMMLLRYTFSLMLVAMPTSEEKTKQNRRSNSPSRNAVITPRLGVKAKSQEHWSLPRPPSGRFLAERGGPVSEENLPKMPRAAASSRSPQQLFWTAKDAKAQPVRAKTQKEKCCFFSPAMG